MAMLRLPFIQVCCLTEKKHKDSSSKSLKFGESKSRTATYRKEFTMNTETKENGEIERDKRDEMEQDKKDDGDHHLDGGSRQPQPWTQQITIRGVVASVIIGSIYGIIAMKLNLTTGMMPNMNVSAALLAFVFMRSWTKMLQKSGIASAPFTRHENTMIQTCSVACYSIAIGGGYRSYLLGLNKKTYELAGGANSLGTYKEPGVGWMMGYSFLVCFIRLFVLIPLRKK